MGWDEEHFQNCEFGFKKGWGLGKGENIGKARKNVHISCELPENSTVWF